MGLKGKIAWAYVFSRKSHSVINLLTVVAMVAVAIPVAAAVLVVSLHNGLGEMVRELYGKFDADIKIEAIQETFFDPMKVDIEDIEGVAQWSRVVEQGVMIENEGMQRVAMLKGVDSNYVNVVGIEGLIIGGEFVPKLGDVQQLVLGQGVAYELGINVAMIKPVTVYGLVGVPLAGLPIFNFEKVYPSGVFALDKESDQGFVFGDIEMAQRVMGKNGMVTAIEVKVDSNANIEKVAKEIQKNLGEQFGVKTRLQQRDALFKIINIEKWVTVMILCVIILIAALSLVGAIVIMVAEKKSQNETLLQLGYTSRDIKSVYNRLAMVIAGVGVFSGVVMGMIVCWAQAKFGFLTMGDGDFIVDAYPVKIVAFDLAVVAAAVVAITLIITIVTTKMVKINTDQE